MFIVILSSARKIKCKVKYTQIPYWQLVQILENHSQANFDEKKVLFFRSGRESLKERSFYYAIQESVSIY